MKLPKFTDNQQCLKNINKRAISRKIINVLKPKIKVCFFFFVFLGPRPQRMEVPRLGVESELQLPAYTTATAMPDLSHVWNLHNSSWQRQILNPLSKTRDRNHILMDTSQVCYQLSHDGNS